MADSVYKVIELVGTSTESWEKAARTAVERASQSLRDLRVAEVVELDMQSPMARSKPTAPRSKYRSNSKVSSSLRGWLQSHSRSFDQRVIGLLSMSPAFTRKERRASGR